MVSYIAKLKRVGAMHTQEDRHRENTEKNDNHIDQKEPNGDKERFETTERR